MSTVRLSTIKDLAREAVYRVSRNPVLIGAATLWAVESVESGTPLTVPGILALAVGWLVRSQVVPLKEVSSIQEAADDILRQVNEAIGEALADE